MPISYMLLDYSMVCKCSLSQKNEDLHGNNLQLAKDNTIQTAIREKIGTLKTDIRIAQSLLVNL